MEGNSSTARGRMWFLCCYYKGNMFVDHTFTQPTNTIVNLHFEQWPDLREVNFEGKVNTQPLKIQYKGDFISCFGQMGCDKSNDDVYGTIS